MNGARKEKGMALLVVLVIVALLTALLTELAFSTMVDLRLVEPGRPRPCDQEQGHDGQRD